LLRERGVPVAECISGESSEMTIFGERIRGVACVSSHAAVPRLVEGQKGHIGGVWCAMAVLVGIVDLHETAGSVDMESAEGMGDEKTYVHCASATEACPRP
jgi:hypothetical protein